MGDQDTIKFTTETNLDLSDYRKYVKTMQGSQVKNNTISIAVCAFLVIMGIYNVYSAKTMLGIFMIVVGIAAPILVRVGAGNQIERDFDKLSEAGGTHFHVRFYEDRFEAQNDTSHGVHEYAKLYKVVETDDAFYLEVEMGHSVIIQKKNCSDELIAFLKTLEK